MPHTMNFFIRVVHRCGLNKLADEMEREFDIACKYEIRVLHCSRNYCKEDFYISCLNMSLVKAHIFPYTLDLFQLPHT